MTKNINLVYVLLIIPSPVLLPPSFCQLKKLFLIILDHVCLILGPAALVGRSMPKDFGIEVHFSSFSKWILVFLCKKLSKVTIWQEYIWRECFRRSIMRKMLLFNKMVWILKRLGESFTFLYSRVEISFVCSISKSPK